MLFGKKKDKTPQAGNAIDPICHMTVPTTTHRKVEHAGKAYYFCSDHCVEQFKAAPQEYAP
jgi:Cu+-exporting ATPase